MSVYLDGTSVLLNSGNVATNAACCCGGICCSGGMTIVPLTNVNYNFSVSGTAVSPSCATVYTLSGSSGAANFPLSDTCSGSDAYFVSIGGILWTFNTSPPGTEMPNCSAETFIFLSCDSSAPSGWKLEAVTVSSSSTGQCSFLCGGAGDILWGGGDTGVIGLGSDPRGTYSLSAIDSMIGTLTWAFAIVIS